MRLFRDRTDAGLLLAKELTNLNLRDPIMVAIPNGGVPVAIPIAGSFKQPLYLAMAVKLVREESRDLGIGALDAFGTSLLNHDVAGYLAYEDYKMTWAAEDAKRKLTRLYQYMLPYSWLPTLGSKTVVLVDDGISTGYTILAATRTLREFEPKEIIIATPVLSSYAVALLGEVRVVALHQVSESKFSIDDCYELFPQVPIEQAKGMLEYHAQACGQTAVVPLGRYIEEVLAPLTEKRQQVNQDFADADLHDHWEAQRETSEEHAHYYHLLLDQCGFPRDIRELVAWYQWETVYVHCVQVAQLPERKRSSKLTTLMSDILKGNYVGDPKFRGIL